MPNDKGRIEVSPPITVKHFAVLLGVRTPDLLLVMMRDFRVRGCHITSHVPSELVELIGLHFGYVVEFVSSD